jgi:hypothetical protein
VEPGRRVVGVGPAGRADDRAPRDRVAARERRRRAERVAGPQPAGVGDGDVEVGGDPPGERDRARTGRGHRRAGSGGEVDAPVPGRVRRRRRVEGTEHATVDRPRPRPGRGSRGGGHAGGRRDHHEREQDGDEQAQGATVRAVVWAGHGSPSGFVRRCARGKSRTSGDVEGPDRSRGRPVPGRLRRGCDRHPVRSGSESRERSWRMAFVWIWQTRLSVTPRTEPISASVSAS